MKRPPAAAALAIDVLIPAPGWTRALPRAATAVRRAARAAWTAGLAARAAPKRRAAGQARAELAVVLTGDAAVRKLNAAYRGKDKPTNVLSFPTGDFPAGAGASRAAGPGACLLGDVVIALATVRREARESGKSLKDHLSHMVVHGVLHLIGYDHETASDAETMERLEIEILSELGIADPYREVIASPRPPARVKRRRP